MKKGVLLIIMCIVSLGVGLSSKFWNYNEDSYLTEKVLEKATPFSVTIDIEYLRNLDPAYEQQ